LRAYGCVFVPRSAYVVLVCKDVVAPSLLFTYFCVYGEPCSVVSKILCLPPPLSATYKEGAICHYWSHLPCIQYPFSLSQFVPSILCDFVQLHCPNSRITREGCVVALHVNSRDFSCLVFSQAQGVWPHSFLSPIGDASPPASNGSAAPCIGTVRPAFLARLVKRPLQQKTRDQVRLVQLGGSRRFPEVPRSQWGGSSAP
jgi:hypothetical protein